MCDVAPHKNNNYVTKIMRTRYREIRVFLRLHQGGTAIRSCDFLGVKPLMGKQLAVMAK
jgi:hypothetical protein